MNKARLEAFSDGVLAIIITIMVLELKVPHGVNSADLMPLVPTFLSYVLSFIYIGIYWSNHHHLFQVVEKVDGKVLWANLHLLFWLSLIPFVTAWAGENNFAELPVAMYGFFLMMAGVAYYLLTQALLANHHAQSVLAQAVGRDFKGKISVFFYLVAIPLAFIKPWFAGALYILVAMMWIIPDRRIVAALNHKKN